MVNFYALMWCVFDIRLTLNYGVSELHQIANVAAKIEAIERLLMSVKTKDEREALVVKFLYMVSVFLNKDAP